ncbi:sigma-70 family RNA polymerase sigma factor [Marinobacter nanhaiticus D15-8W]|uniref:Sigma-70 family RNA polymerase sigma factor n=1 Tax=Marinobacter nanhaiticus D15-8W TaxID=626887 RepID=N6VYP2_9GAMM|nr:sigma-70 family RNA polymerase sigma factor [Marinobacter nanhaiticus]ENO12989.1 sigma-70 family RNA polymerase sigma factor [Marinobacter nanhaiticus D15-8W]BES70343.1 sigma-70 family RNA polymerase sigma factor [Marinobacter nanhaiticus D15-8W]
MDEIRDMDFEAHRGMMKGLAYRMLGTVSEAEDVVQDAYLRWHNTDRAHVENPRAFLSTIVSRLCLDRWKEARRRRETYVGPWLPEPLIDELASPIEEDLAHDVSVALMLALERLSPLERAAFLLHDVFDMGFSEVARALDRTEAACRQLAKRARENVQKARPRFDVASEENERIAEAFFAASRAGDTAALSRLLAEGAVLHTDGGGVRPAALRLIRGADKVCRFFAGIVLKKRGKPPLWARQVVINGMPGWLTIEADGLPQTTTLAIVNGRITDIYVMRNPNKMDHLATMVPEPVLKGGGEQ